jgi:hypothetical protein
LYVQFTPCWQGWGEFRLFLSRAGSAGQKKGAEDQVMGERGIFELLERGT